MLLNRRAMLQASIGAVALSLSGCNKTVTKVVFVNASNNAKGGPAVKLSVNAAAKGHTFKKNNIQPGHQASQTYRTKDTKGSKVAVTGTVTPAGASAIDLGLFGFEITLGATNTFTFYGLNAIDPIVLS